MRSVSALTGADVSRLHSSRECEMQMRAWGYSCTTVVDSQSFSLDGSPPPDPHQNATSPLTGLILAPLFKESCEETALVGIEDVFVKADARWSRGRGCALVDTTFA